MKMQQREGTLPVCRICHRMSALETVEAEADDQDRLLQRDSAGEIPAELEAIPTARVIAAVGGIKAQVGVAVARERQAITQVILEGKVQAALEGQGRAVVVVDWLLEEVQPVEGGRQRMEIMTAAWW